MEHHGDTQFVIVPISSQRLTIWRDWKWSHPESTASLSKCNIPNIRSILIPSSISIPTIITNIFVRIIRDCWYVSKTCWWMRRPFWPGLPNARVTRSLRNSFGKLNLPKLTGAEPPFWKRSGNRPIGSDAWDPSLPPIFNMHIETSMNTCWNYFIIIFRILWT